MTDQPYETDPRQASIIARGNLELALYRRDKEAWAAYIYMQYTSNKELLKLVWESLDAESQDQIRVIRKL